MEITPQELKSRLDQGEKLTLIDVREPVEVGICSLEQAKHIPLGELPDRLNEFKPDTSLILYCHHGPRSMQAAQFLRHKGFENAFSLEGGIDAWAEEIDPEMERY